MPSLYETLLERELKRDRVQRRLLLRAACLIIVLMIGIAILA